MEKTQKTLMIVAGEDSGDLHGAHLIQEIQKRAPEISFMGLGGPKMRACGVELIADLTKISVVGFFEVLKHYKTFKRIFDLFLETVDQVKPECVILIDYPGFNLRLAKELKKRKIKAIYYISPQVWAWKKGRIKQIKANVDKMLVIFPFEKDFYEKEGVDVEFVGHPLIDSAVASQTKAQFLDTNSLSKDKMTFALMPGSRFKEVDRHLPVMIETAEILFDEFSQLQFLIVKAPSIESQLIVAKLADSTIPYRIIKNNHYDAINASDFCLVASGTATLEIALFAKPMAIIYKTSWITWLIAKLLVRIPYIGIVNIISKRKIVPEFVQHNARPKKIADYIRTLLTDEIKIAEVKKDLKEMRNTINVGDVSARAAEVILKNI